MQKTTLGFNLYEKDDTFDVTGETGLNATIEKINEVVETMAEKIKQIQTAGYGMHGKTDTTITSDGTVKNIYGACTIEQEGE